MTSFKWKNTVETALDIIGVINERAAHKYMLAVLITKQIQKVLI